MPDVLAENPRVVIGNNAPPLSPYEKAQARIDELHAEASLWLNGDPVSSQEVCDGIANLQRMIADAKKTADAARKTENEPFDTGKAEVQARYNPLLAKADQAITACKKAQEPWLKHVQAENDRKAKESREAYEAARHRAAEMILDVSGSANLSKREAAEGLIKEAQRQLSISNKASRATANAGGAVGRRSGLRSVWTAKLDNFSLALGHYVMAEPEQLREFLQGLADTEVRAGKRDIPGFKIVEEQTVV